MKDILVTYVTVLKQMPRGSLLGGDQIIGISAFGRHKGLRQAIVSVFSRGWPHFFKQEVYKIVLMLMFGVRKMGEETGST